MDKNLLNEIERIHNIMNINSENTKTFLSEATVQQDVISFLRKLMIHTDEELGPKILKQESQQVKDILEKIKNGSTLKNAEKQIIKDILDFPKMANYIINSEKVMGRVFVERVEQYIEKVKVNPSKYDKAINNFNRAIDESDFLKNAPDELKINMKKDFKASLDAAYEIGKKRSSLIKIIKKGWEEGRNSPSLFMTIWRTIFGKNRGKEFKILLNYLISGSTRSLPKGFKELSKELVSKGISKKTAEFFAKKIVAMTSELTYRWLYATIILEITNMIYEWVTTHNDSDKYDNFTDPQALLDWIIRNYPNHPFLYIWPPKYLYPILVDIARNKPSNEILQHVINIHDGAKKEVKQIEDEHPEIGNWDEPISDNTQSTQSQDNTSTQSQDSTSNKRAF